jgi:hypothetical protein
MVWGGGGAQVVECLLCKQEALSSKPNPTLPPKKKKKKKRAYRMNKLYTQKLKTPLFPYHLPHHFSREGM